MQSAYIPLIFQSCIKRRVCADLTNRPLRLLKIYMAVSILGENKYWAAREKEDTVPLIGNQFVKDDNDEFSSWVDKSKSVEMQGLKGDHEEDTPSTNGPPYHSEYILEAREPQQPLAFPTTVIGMLPPEIREKIYIEALTIDSRTIEDYAYFGGRYYYSPSCKWNESPEWIKDHRSFARKDGRICWPQAKSSSALALLAEFPWPTHLRSQSRLALLQTCRQIYNEAWHLYYSTNHFQFTDVSHLLKFQRKLEAKRRRELTSISVMQSLQRSYDPGDPLAECLTYLTDCPNLKELNLILEFEDQHCFKILKKLRGLKHVSLHTRLQPHHFEASLPAWRMPSWSLKDRERIWSEVAELNVLLLQPKR